MLVLGLNGSPLAEGITSRLLASALDGAAAAGAETKSIFLYDLKIAPSDGCEKCVGECDIHDDNVSLYRLYREMDAVVVALPVYFESVPAHVKAAIDRCQAIWMDKHLNKKRIAPRKRPGGLIATAGSKNFLQFGYTFHIVRSWLTTVEVRLLRSQFIPGLDEEAARKRDQAVLGDARTMGAELAALAASPPVH